MNCVLPKVQPFGYSMSVHTCTHAETSKQQQQNNPFLSHTMLLPFVV